ncbi:hypothetical protein [Clostridium neonatale]|uniref:hypothetical protein n=1 Tax=Clostridium neonatale TaxID=137838 RepID=UPI00397A805F
MSRTIRCTYTGECPYLNQSHSIDITYTEMRMLGNPNPEYKKGSYSCDEIEDCPYPSKDKWGRCPVYLDSPSNPY